MGIFDELKRMAHPFEDEDEDFEELDDMLLDDDTL